MRRPVKLGAIGIVHLPGQQRQVVVGRDVLRIQLKHTLEPAGSLGHHRTPPRGRLSCPLLLRPLEERLSQLVEQPVVT